MSPIKLYRHALNTIECILERIGCVPAGIESVPARMRLHWIYTRKSREYGKLTRAYASKIASIACVFWVFLSILSTYSRVLSGRWIAPWIYPSVGRSVTLSPSEVFRSTYCRVSGLCKRLVYQRRCLDFRQKLSKVKNKPGLNFR